jgi:heptosyltransferase-2
LEIDVITGPAELDILNELSNIDFPSNISIAESSSFGEMLDRIGSAQVVVTNDSGPAHVANLLGKQTIVLWGGGNYDRIRPIGDNIHIIKIDIDCRPCVQYKSGDICVRGHNLCLESITPDIVMSTIEEAMSHFEKDQTKDNL